MLKHKKNKSKYQPPSPKEKYPDNTSGVGPPSINQGIGVINC